MDELKPLQNRIHAWNIQFDLANSLPVNNSSEELVNEFFEFSGKIRQARWGNVDIVLQMLTMLDHVSDGYLQMSPAKRSELRDLVANDSEAKIWLKRYAGLANFKLQHTGDPRWLEKALAAFSILDQGTDFREEYFAIGALYLAANEVGIEPESYFKAFGEISNSDIRPYSSGLSTKELLSAFRTSPFFVENVQPKLRGTK